LPLRMDCCPAPSSNVFCSLTVFSCRACSQKRSQDHLSIGLIALLDDIAAIAKVAAASLDDVVAHAAKVGAKTAGLVVDDAAVSPRYLIGFAANRELPIIRGGSTSQLVPSPASRYVGPELFSPVDHYTASHIWRCLSLLRGDGKSPRSHQPISGTRP